ncbi:hypothetical protein FHT91_005623 [Rhizobium sp. BK347]|nr:hypothetical protein [Rhizobium sp. BK252]MBB3405329.1 hypothetical protein [Rhizobium sp. BK289]MBB3417876.1 hypothetical protein [Rhizobium sp. BK284]MBB3485813.1 hypothetical protein [Rhizobium sp. BK347]
MRGGTKLPLPDLPKISGNASSPRAFRAPSPRWNVGKLSVQYARKPYRFGPFLA